MNILLITIWKPRKGGIVTRVENLIRFSKHNFSIITYEKYINLPLLRAISFVVHGFFKAILMRFDIIHAHYAIPQGFLGLLLKKVKKKPLIITVHGSDVLVLGKNRIAKFLVANVLKNANYIIAVSKYLKREVVNLGVEESKVKVIYAGISFSLENEKEEKGKEKRVVYIGSLVKQKGVDILLKAFKDINAELFIVGDGKERDSLEKISGKKVYFLGERKNLDKIFSKASVLVLPSREEGFGLVLLEAMSRGIPVVATRVGGIPEIINKSGLLVERENVEELRKAMTLILNNRKIAKKFSYLGRKTAKKFSWRKMAHEVDCIYEALVS